MSDEGVPFREDIDAELRAQLASSEASLAAAMRQRDEAVTQADRAERNATISRRAKTLGVYAGFLASATAFAVVLAIGSVSIKRCADAPPTPPPPPPPADHPSAGERTNAARIAAVAFVRVLYPDATPRATCTRRPADGFEDESWSQQEQCTVLVGNRAFTLTCDDQLGGANRGCSDLRPMDLR